MLYLVKRKRVLSCNSTQKIEWEEMRFLAKANSSSCLLEQFTAVCLSIIVCVFLDSHISKILCFAVPQITSRHAIILKG